TGDPVLTKDVLYLLSHSSLTLSIIYCFANVVNYMFAICWEKPTYRFLAFLWVIKLHGGGICVTIKTK
ncbi:MAG: hypothetical protein J1F66_02275, partial [Clostridiales bacterium]|nr:hypothetical protein [Clostridiales bacterium]